MKQIVKGLLSIALVLMIAVLGFLIYGNFQEHKNAIEEAQHEDAVAKDKQEIEKVNEENPEPVETVDPNAELTNTTDISLAFLGDIVCHSGLNDEAKQTDGTYDYTKILSGTYDVVNGADYAACTMETTFADTTSYSGYPQFMSPDTLATSLKSSGFDLINTASNHCMDGYKGGLFRTLDVLDETGLDHVGTYRSQEERDKNNGILVKEINGVSIAFLSFTYGTNAIPVTGYEYVANIFYKDYLNTLMDIDYDFIKNDMAAARALNTDLIVVIPHWGTEYETTPVSYQQELADLFFAEGADLVIGGHCHVPEPMELRQVIDNEGNEKTGLLAYCLGNLISCQNDPYTNLTVGIHADIQKNNDTGDTYITHVSYTPMFMVDASDYGASGDFRYRLLNLHVALDAYDNGDNLGIINDRMYTAMQAAVDDVHNIVGTEFDYTNGGVDVNAVA